MLRPRQIQGHAGRPFERLEGILPPDGDRALEDVRQRACRIAAELGLPDPVTTEVRREQRDDHSVVEAELSLTGTFAAIVAFGERLHVFRVIVSTQSAVMEPTTTGVHATKLTLSIPFARRDATGAAQTAVAGVAEARERLIAMIELIDRLKARQVSCLRLARALATHPVEVHRFVWSRESKLLEYAAPIAADAEAVLPDLIWQRFLEGDDIHVVSEPREGGAVVRVSSRQGQSD